MLQAWRCACMAHLPGRQYAEGCAWCLSADRGTGMAPEQRAAACGGLQQWRLPVELWQVSGGRSACTEGGCGWHPSDSLAVIPEDIPCRWAIDLHSLVELWQQSDCMQSAGHEERIVGPYFGHERALLCSLQSNTANVQVHVDTAQHPKPSAVHAGPVISLAWHPNGSLLAAAVRNTPGFTLFDVSSGLSTPVAAGKLMPRCSRATHCVAYCIAVS